MFAWQPKWLIWSMAWVMASAPVVACAQQPAAAAEPLDLSLVSPETFMAGVAHPHRVIHSPAMELMPREIIAAATKQEIGVDVTTVSRVLWFAEAPEIQNGRPAGPPAFGLVAEFAAPLDFDVLRSKLHDQTEPAEIVGKDVLQLPGGGPTPTYIYLAGSQRIVVGTESVIQRAIEGAPEAADNQVAQILRTQAAANDTTVIVSLDKIRPLVDMALQQTPPLPPNLAKFKQAPNLISMVALRMNISQPGPTGLALLAHDEDEAKQLEQLINEGLELGRQLVLAEIRKEAAGPNANDAVQQATQQYLMRVSESVVNRIRPQRSSNRLTLETTVSPGNVLASPATSGILIALLLPAIQAAREAARRNVCVNNLRQLAVAMHNYHDARRSFPPAALADEQGNRLLSWRVALLPYLGQQPLYDQFHLDEPWDSEHNKALIEKMPRTFACPSGNLPPGHTRYLVPTGKGTMFAGSEGTKITDIRDGLANSLMIVEVADEHAVPWTKPADLPLDPDMPAARLGSAHSGGVFNAALGDASVRTVTGDLDAQTLRGLFTISGGEGVQLP